MMLLLLENIYLIKKCGCRLYIRIKMSKYENKLLTHLLQIL